MMSRINILYVFEAFLTGCIFFTVAFYARKKVIYNRLNMGSQSVFLQEVQSLSQNMSSIFKPEAYPQVLDNVRHDYQVKTFNHLDRDEATSLFRKIPVAYPEFGAEWILENERKNFTDPDNFPRGLLDVMAKTALSMNEYQDFWPQFYVGLHLRDILGLHSQNASYSDDHNLQGIVDFYSKSFCQLRVVDTNLSFVVDTAVPCNDFVDLICIKEKFYNSNDLNASTAEINQTLGANSCEAKARIDIASDLASQCSNNELVGMYELVENAYIESGKIDRLEGLILCFVAMCLMSLLTDWCEQVYFFNMGFIDFEGIRIPGSYFKKVVNVISLWLFVFSVLMDFLSTNSTKTMVATDTQWVYLMTFSFVLRCVMFIHRMRFDVLFGKSVFTNFMVGEHRFRYCVVVVGVVYIFGTALSIIVIHPQCANETLASFRNLSNAMLSTVGHMFGHGNMDAFYTHIPVKVSDVMLIAVMGFLLMILCKLSTAETVMKEPGIETLLFKEWLQEALSAEYTFAVLSLPFRYCGINKLFKGWVQEACTVLCLPYRCRSISKTNYTRHREAGYIVKRGDDGKVKMFIPVQNLPVQNLPVCPVSRRWDLPPYSGFVMLVTMMWIALCLNMGVWIWS